MNTKYKKLSLNMVLFSISSFGQKILAFLLIPLYTGYLTTEQYGTIDLITTTVNLLVPILTLNVGEAVMRFTIEKKKDDSYLTYGLLIMIKGLLVLVVCLFLLSILPFLAPFRVYFPLLVILYISNSLYSLMQNYLRAVDKIRLMVGASLLNSALTLVLNVLLIAKYRLGISGYYIAANVGLFTAIVVMTVGSNFFHHIHFKIENDKAIKRECLSYCIPTVFTALAWWINSSLDKYFVSGLCGVAANGIYSIAYKIPTILGVFQTIFSQAWTLSAIKEFDREDKDGFFGNTYSMYNSMMVLITAAIMFFNIPLSKILYANEFYGAWKYVPMLLISSLFSAMAGYLGSIFSAVMDTKTCAYSTIASALVNTALNAILIPSIGITGAAVATVIAYVVAWAVRMVVSRRYIQMKITIKRDLFVYGMLLVQAYLAVQENALYFAQLAIVVMVIVVYNRNYKAAVLGLTRKMLNK